MRSALAQSMAAAVFLAGAPALAQPSNRNAIQAATDAFGVTVGIEKIGVYTSDQVRGFSPTTAGNLRIDGLYFDQAGELNRRLVDRSTIRVGLAAQAYPFPAPTGIVDNHLRTPGAKLSISGSAGLADYAGPYFDTDIQIPIMGDKLGLVVGFGRKDDEFPDGSNSDNRTIALLGQFQPRTSLRLRTFWTQIVQRNVETQPLLTVGGQWLPPQLVIRKYLGQDWETNQHTINNSGLLADANLGSGWLIRGGLFRSIVSDTSTYADIFQDVQPNGAADHLIVANPRQGIRSTSGELRLSHAFGDGPVRQIVQAIVRGRDRQTESGGSDQIDAGPTNVRVPDTIAKPTFLFTQPNQDRVHQFTGGIAYEGYWNGIGQIGVGLQKTHYSKSFRSAGKAPVETSDAPLLFYGSVEVQLSQRLALFAGITRGLEETGVAPDNAANRGEPLAAARTRQIDGGISYSLTKGVRLVAAAFDVSKPYFNLDQNNVFTALGTETHLGIEMSLTGPLTPRLNIVAGAVLLDARTSGEAVSLGRIGDRPINSSPLIVRINAEYSLPRFRGLSIDGGIDHDGKRVASGIITIRLPPRTILRVGGRYHFRLGHLNTQVRILVDNVTDRFSWVVTSGGGFRVDVGRRITGYVAVDF